MRLSIIGLPKAFEGHIGVIQRNAIESWTRLGGDSEVILLGSDTGTAQVASELGVAHVPEVAENGSGTPLVSDLLRLAEQHAKGDVVCYVNADIILFDDFVAAARRATESLGGFLMIGRRTDLDVTERVAFVEGWQAPLRQRAAALGSLHAETGLDYFVFTRGVFGTIPPLALGRTVWDNWLLYRARQRGADLVDASASVLAIHQNHGYGSRTAKDIWRSPEAQENLRLAGGSHHVFTALDATWALTPSGLRRPDSVRHRWRNAVTWPMLRMGWELPTKMALRAEYRVLRAGQLLALSRRTDP